MSLITRFFSPPSRTVVAKRKRSGFTLLELLVVIAIIGILIAMGAVAFGVAQRKGRDAKRRADMKAIQDGFEQYYAENGEYDTCAVMLADPTIFPGGGPSDPQPPKAYTCNENVNGFTYCTCAVLDDTDAGNSVAQCASYGSGVTHYCLTNLQ